LRRAARYNLRGPSTAERTRHPAGEEDQRCACEGRQDAQSDQRVAEEPARQRRDGRDQRRMIDVAPVEVVATGDEIQLVDPVAVPAAECEMQCEDG